MMIDLVRLQGIQTNNSECFQHQSEVINTGRINKLQDIAGYLPQAGECCHIAVSGGWSTWKLAPYLIYLFGDCSKLYLATFNIGTQAISDLFALMDAGKVKAADVVVSDTMERLREGNKPLERLVQLTNFFPETFRVKALDIHAKVLGLRFEDRSFVIMGSGNMSRNSNKECYCIFNSHELFNFYANWIEGML